MQQDFRDSCPAVGDSMDGLTNFGSCPYKGLDPYTEADHAFFFGRARDCEIISSNLYASPLTVLYGESGVGKSSVLRAAVLPQLQTTRVAVLVFRDWQVSSVLPSLKENILTAVSRSIGPKSSGIDLTLPLDDFLFQCLINLRGNIFIILDQFEEYFLYHPHSKEDNSFDVEFARAVNRSEITANFMLSMREDSLSKLDRFRGRIPHLLNNLLRLEHLSRGAAEDAIRKPIDVFNRSLSREQVPFRIEDSLVRELLEQVRTGKVTLRQTGRGEVGNRGDAPGLDDRIEASFLQLVLRYLWDEEVKAGSRTLRLESLIRLGSAERIIRSHLDKVMDKLSEDQRASSAKLFRFLVTPDGMKIALSVPVLANWADRSMEEVQALMQTLSDPETRVIRPISPAADQPDVWRYEIFHDVLAPAILDWRTRYVQKKLLVDAERKAKKEAEQRARREAQQREVQQATALAEEQRRRAEEQEKRAEAQRLAAIQAWELVKVKARVTVWMGLAITCLVIMIFVAIFMYFRLRSNYRDAQSHKLAYLANEKRSEPDLCILLAVDAVYVAHSAEKRTSDQSEIIAALDSALQVSEAKLSLSSHHAEVRDVVISPDAQVRDVVISPDFRFASSLGSDNVLHIWGASKIAEPAKSLPLTSRPGDLSTHPQPIAESLKTNTSDSIPSVSRASLSGNSPPLRPESSKYADSPYGNQGNISQSAPSCSVSAFEGNKRPLGSWDEPRSLWQSTSLDPYINRDGGNERIISEVFSDDGRYLASAGIRGTTTIWDIKSGCAIKVLPVRRRVISLAFSSAKTHLLAVGDLDGAVLLWDLDANRTKGLTYVAGPVVALAFGRRNDLQLAIATESTVDLFDVSSGRAVAFPEKHSSLITALAFSPDEKLLVTASLDKTARVWNVNTRTTTKILKHPTGIASVLFSADGKRLATSGLGGTVIIWDTDKWNEVMRVSDSGRAVAMSPDGNRLLTTGTNGILSIHSVVLDDAIKRAYSKLLRKFTDKECTDYIRGPGCNDFLTDVRFWHGFGQEVPILKK